MIRAAVVAGWPVLVLAVGGRFAPRRRAVLPAASWRGPQPNRSGPLTCCVETVGGWVRRAARLPDDPVRARSVGIVVLTTIPLVVMLPMLAPVPGLIALAAPRLRARRARVRAVAAVIDDLPDVVDLLVLAAGAGLTAVLAVEAVSHRARGPVGIALADAHRRVQLGEPPARSFHGVAGATAAPDAVRPLSRALVTAVEEGVPLEPALRRVAAEVRLTRRRAAEVEARRVPVRLLFPLVVCTLPAFVVLTVVPLLVAGLDSLDL